jgi:hypothetical protein
MPTFFLIKNKEVVRKIVGANPDGVKKLVDASAEPCETPQMSWNSRFRLSHVFRNCSVRLTVSASWSGSGCPRLSSVARVCEYDYSDECLSPCSSSSLACWSGPGADCSVTLNVALFWG